MKTGTLQVNGCTFSTNTATGGVGGKPDIPASWDIPVPSVEFGTGKSGKGYGGAIFVYGGTLSGTGNTYTNNTQSESVPGNDIYCYLGSGVTTNGAAACECNTGYAPERGLHRRG